ncbi:unnamed protein product, partial [marine sediment metagenome]
FFMGIVAFVMNIIAPAGYLEIIPILGTFTLAVFRLIPIIGTAGSRIMSIMETLPPC